MCQHETVGGINEQNDRPRAPLIYGGPVHFTFRLNSNMNSALLNNS